MKTSPTKLHRSICPSHFASLVVLLLLTFGIFSDTARAISIQALSLKRDFRYYVGADKAFAGDPYNWSGVTRTVFQKAPDGVTQWGGKWATMVSPSYFLSANHWHPANGETLRFYHTNNPSGTYEDRVVLSGQLIDGFDLWLGKLSTPVSSAVAKYPILLLANDAAYVGKPFFILGRPTSDNSSTSPTQVHMGKNWIDMVAPPTFTWGNSASTLPGKAITCEGGDSGGSSFIISHGVPTVLGIHWHALADSFVPRNISAINAAMLASGEQVTVQNTYYPPPVLGPTTYFQNEGEYELQPEGALGMRLDADAATNNVRIWAANGQNSQRWIAQEQTTGIFELISKASLKRLNVAGNGGSGANVIVYLDDNGANSRWRAANSFGVYLIPQHNTGLRLRVDSAGSTNGTNVSVGAYPGSGNLQKWRLIRIN